MDFPCWYDSSQDLTETPQVHCTGPTEKHSLVAPSGTFWQRSIEHLKEIQLGQWLNKCIQGQRKYFPTLLLISWLTAERTGIANFIWGLEVLCLWTAQKIVPLFFSLHIPRALLWVEEGKGNLIIFLFFAFHLFFFLFSLKHVNMHHIHKYTCRKMYIFLKTLKALPKISERAK